jgi:galactokinase
MYASHESSRKLFENSTPHLDLLVELARGLPGVLGSRLTGGGFGGATISLVESGASAQTARLLAEAYFEQTGISSQGILCESADGALPGGVDDAAN